VIIFVASNDEVLIVSRFHAFYPLWTFDDFPCPSTGRFISCRLFASYPWLAELGAAFLAPYRSRVLSNSGGPITFLGLNFPFPPSYSAV